LEKAIEIKRRAQRCIQNGDLDGALAEYEKLVGFEDSDPYNYVLLADLLFKKGEQSEAAERYLSAVAAYEKASLYKNAIAVCKKMTRLSLSPAKVLQALANLHALDGLAGEASLYYVQYAEHMVRSSAPAEAASALRKAFDVCQDNIKVLEQLSEAWLLAGDQHQAAQALVEAAGQYKQRGQAMDENRCLKRAATLDASVTGPVADEPAGAEISHDETPADADRSAMPAAHAPPAEGLDKVEAAREEAEPAPGLEIEPTARGSVMMARPDLEKSHEVEGFETGRHSTEGRTAEAPKATEAAAEEPAGASPDDFAVSETEIEAYGAVEASDDGEEEGEDGDVQYVIDEDGADGEDATAADEPDDTSEEEEGEAVYEIGEDDAVPLAESGDSSEGDGKDAGVVVIEDEEASSKAAAAAAPAPTPKDSNPAAPQTAPPAPAPEPVGTSAPGLSFGSPAAKEPRAPQPEPAAAQGRGPTTQEIGLQQVEALLTQAQDQFRSGEREQASVTLARAAQAYEVLGRFDSAATIYRSLGRSANVAKSVLELWLVNCERRADKKEAATVACEMGDRALNGGDAKDAKHWFQRAIGFDAQNEIAKRRLQRLENGGPPGVGAGALAPTAPAATPVVMEEGRVEVAVGRGEAVTFDLSGLLSEFQRGVEAQLAGDAQSHYDLGMTYREMGLLEQAVDSFRVAVGDPRLAPRALEMIGRCHADQARWAEAVGEFRRALQQPMEPGADGELRFHYAQALVELGETEAALAEYEAVSATMPGFEDVDERIAALRRVLGRA